MDTRAELTSLHLVNFKAHRNFSLALRRANVLIGPFQAGKSSIVGAFRALSSGLRTARAQLPELLLGPAGAAAPGYRVPHADVAPLGNVHTEGTDGDTVIRFGFANGSHVRFFFPRSGGCFLFATTAGGEVPATPAAFVRAFPLTVGVVPRPMPVPRTEPVLDDTAVRDGAAGPDAWLRFRNYWHHHPADFERFTVLLRATCPGWEVALPEPTAVGDLAMLCCEDDTPRELFWTPVTFQAWCQLLTHLLRTSGDTLVAMDEPEFHLSPELQHELPGVLRALGPATVVATHSKVILAQAEPADVVAIDKSRHAAAVRLGEVLEIQEVYDAIPAPRARTLLRVARQQRLLFVEGPDDAAILRGFARALALPELAAGADFTAVEAGSFGSVEPIRGFARVFGEIVKSEMRIAAVFGNSRAEEAAALREERAPGIVLVHVLRRPDLESYLLEPAVLRRLLAAGALERLERWWGEVEAGPVSGKQALARLRAALGEVELDAAALAAAFRAEEIDAELVELLHRLDAFRRPPALAGF